MVECARKLTLTGVFVIVLRGSLLQATLAVLLMVAFTLTLCHLRPYAEEHGDSRTNALAVVTNTQLVIVLQASLVLQAASITPAAGSSNDPLVGLNDGALSAVLILASASSVVVLAYLVYADGRRYLRDGEEREGAGAESTGAGAEDDAQSTSMKTAEVQQLQSHLARMEAAEAQELARALAAAAQEAQARAQALEQRRKHQHSMALLLRLPTAAPAPVINPVRKIRL